MAQSCLIIEDHHLYAEALQLVLSSAMPHFKFDCVPTLGEARKVISTNRTRPFDLVILDLCLPDSDGFLGLLELRRLTSGTPVVIISAFFSRELVQTAISFGASGYIPKSLDRNSIVRLVRESEAGKFAAPKGYDLDLDRECLTLQQLRVLEMVSRGLLNKQIAYRLGVCETTIKAHVSEILRKLGVASRTQAVLKVVQAYSSSSWDCCRARIPVDANGVGQSLQHANAGDSHG